MLTKCVLNHYVFQLFIRKQQDSRQKNFLCPSAERLRLCSFGDFLHMYYKKHLIDFPSSESLASVFNSSSFKRSISPLILSDRRTVCVKATNMRNFEWILFF